MRIECFISYSREDSKLALQIIDLLKSQGIESWWDQNISPATSNFVKDIGNAILKCQCFLVIWTGNSLKSDWVINETTCLQDTENGKDKIVSLSINGTRLPFPFNSRQFLSVQLGDDNKINEKDQLKIISAVKSRIGIIGKNEHIIHPRHLDEAWEFDDLAIEGPIPGTDLLLSFRPCGNSGTFLIMHFRTTDGWVKNDIESSEQRHEIFRDDPNSTYTSGNELYLKIKNDVYFIKDPIRPYSIQIGGIRSKRPNAKPGIIEGCMTVGQLETLPIQLYWLSLTLAEILTDCKALERRSVLIEKYGDEWGQDKLINVKDAISRNPFSPPEIQKGKCKFCDTIFKEKRKLYKKYKTTLIANDFPFGPNFHYIAILDDPIHSWEDATYEHLLGINQITHEFLSKKENRFGSVGVEFGFNSTVRHLVLGSRTHSSAGASVPHLHKQIWGMATRTSNLAEQLIIVSEAYSNMNIDYQDCYIAALRNADYVIWEDNKCVLYVPYGQCSLHELQIMIKRPCGSFIEFDKDEVVALSQAEYIVFKIYKTLGITSFNSILITKLFNDARAPTFRVIQTFVTREVDLAISELSMLYVVDQHPSESAREIKQAFEKVKEEDLQRF